MLIRLFIFSLAGPFISGYRTSSSLRIAGMSSALKMLCRASAPISASNSVEYFIENRWYMTSSSTTPTWMLSISRFVSVNSFLRASLVFSSPAAFDLDLNSLSSSRTNRLRSSSCTLEIRYPAKYTTFSTSEGVIPRISEIRDGMDLRNQMCDTGDARSMCPIRSRRTIDRVISTPHFSQTIPLYRIPLYFPQ